VSAEVTASASPAFPTLGQSVSGVLARVLDLLARRQHGCRLDIHAGAAMPRHCGDARRKDVVVRKAVCMPPVPVRGGTRVTERPHALSTSSGHGLTNALPVPQTSSDSEGKCKHNRRLSHDRESTHKERQSGDCPQPCKKPAVILAYILLALTLLARL